MAAQPNPPATLEQFRIRFSEYAERNDTTHGDLSAEIHTAGNRMSRWVVGTGIAVIVALGALDLLG